MREIGYYWGLNHKTEDSIDKWGIYFWDGNCFWSDGVDFSECSFVRIDNTEISNIER
jgi:hypothetical protein